ncbi:MULTISPECIES: vitamin B12 ABC transporter permease BtuC [Providencia]|uniref:Vitamin B12 import system permease protein BtuC n=1 Tax=Providencia stuartii ATCC 25827 TaxID=471874 RepID=A0AA87CQM8_PROST|nr:MULTISPECIES: vitamin B12 ABC transporter permease BtuC [Providencia]EDU59072.1 iron chelate uptake ABC transporter, FeCT family, permease protein [Providencia stuartii ATCC 25827]EMF0918838.1 vitamin B12 ABC transporter permease BtuC [Providencia stuartii]MBS7784005.1 vitamin B12 ABC transporter permease BtuC [Providencia thailandensis]MCR4079560.1 vitamin B12 ABC transporter permease BtuC [Providencia stuartii]MDN0007814.1 vitamin B12 ABC transporter permease BtuC [Providencia stuartii]
MNNQLLTLQKRQRHADIRLLCVLVCFLIVVSVLALSVGEVGLWPNQWASESAQLFIWQIRFPRLLAVITIGAALAVTGAIMQALFENPLAEPGLLGISNGAGVAVVLIVLLSHGVTQYWLISSGAIVGALLLTAILLFFAKRKHFNNTSLLLVGVALGVICGAIMTWMVYMSSSLDLRQLLYWMMGSFSGIDWRQFALVIACIPFLLWAICQGNTLNYLSLGSLQAYQLGFSHHRWRLALIIVTGVLIGLSVAIAGAISFVGLVIPHILRLAGLTDHRTLLPGCAITGAGGLLLADMLSRTLIANAEVPIGVITATLGAPIFIWLLARNNQWR